MKEFGLEPRPQGARGTCSIFVTCVAIEFAAGECVGASARLSPEFLNWAAGQAAKRPSDGNFFHNALAGYERFGVCTEATMPYQHAFDAAREPTAAACAEGQKLRDSLRQRTGVRWIVPWVPNRFGLTPEQFTDVKRVIAAGHPVAAGSAHSRLLVGYRDDEHAPGGGVFVALDSALNRFDDVTYEFVRTQVADAFCIEPRAPTQVEPPAGSAR